MSQETVLFEKKKSEKIYQPSFIQDKQSYMNRKKNFEFIHSTFTVLLNNRSLKIGNVKMVVIGGNNGNLRRKNRFCSLVTGAFSVVKRCLSSKQVSCSEHRFMPPNSVCFNAYKLPRFAGIMLRQQQPYKQRPLLGCSKINECKQRYGLL